ncbi:hypothetical protein [Halorussus halophilus]|uniref:hypothetical protein n=1 Tax=Halorussus halophilus TaxID=2650975 RepID=UPI0013010F0F|nr:hypothetical protein [Halorussus halophilus]
MERREYLVTTASAVGTALAAGCTGSDPESQSDGSPTTEAHTTTEAQTEAHLEKAGEALDKAAEKISEESDKFSEVDISNSGIDFKTATINEYLDTASNELDAAEESASDRQLEWIDTARDYIAFARKFTEFGDTTAEGFSQINTGLAYFDSERYTDAAEALKEAQNTIDKADDALTLVQDRADKMDTSVLNDLDQIEITSLQTNLSDLDEAIPVLSVFAKGLRDVALGMVDFTEASTNIDNSNYTKAQQLFSEAESDFASAHSAFKDKEESAPSSVKSSIIELTCYSNALKDGSSHLATAAAAIENGNQERAEEASEKGKQALNRCDFSS